MSDPSDWKDRYQRLQTQHRELTKQYNEKTEQLKRTNVQLTKIENLLKQKALRNLIHKVANPNLLRKNGSS